MATPRSLPQLPMIAWRQAPRLLPRACAQQAWLCRVGSFDQSEQPVPAHVPRPPPDFPDVRTILDRKEDDLRTADDVFVRHVADLAEHAAVGRVVAIVAHHEIMA